MIALVLYGLSKACIYSETCENFTPSASTCENLIEILNFCGNSFIRCLLPKEQV